MMMMNCFCGMVDRREALTLISSWDHCQRSSPSGISDTPRAGFEPGLKFDIADFYPSIAEHLLERSIEYAQSFATIEDKTLEAILLAHKSLLFSKDEIWVKKDNSSFDVTV